MRDEEGARDVSKGESNDMRRSFKGKNRDGDERQI